MPPTVAIVGCLDTKGEEVLYLKQVLETAGCRSHVIDAGILGAPPFAADTPRGEVARAGGTSLEELQARADRGHAVKVMAAGATAVARELQARGAIQGIIAAGGSASTSIGTQAMRALPVGFPKVMVSTLASGDVAPYVGTRDIMMLYSVVDIAGVNRLSCRILGNAARAVAAMALGAAEPPPGSRPLLAATMFGVTTPCVTEARKILEAAGFEVLVFHATGTGGRAMEDLIEEGHIAGVLDVTTTELADELAGGVLSAGPRRLTVAGRAGVPQVVSVGALDMVNFGPRATVPEKFRHRQLYEHNPQVTLMRTTPEECAEIGRRIASRLNAARGPVEVVLPLRGVSLYAREGGPFHDREADARCLRAIREHLDPRIPIHELDTDLNDPAFARLAAERLIALLAATGGGRKEVEP